MRTFRLIPLFIVVLVISCHSNNETTSIPLKKAVRTPTTANTKQDTSKFPVFDFVSTSHDFGNIKKESIVDHSFIFRNIGKVPLKIEKIEASCGCTAVNYAIESILPGDSGKIQVIINTKSNPDYQSSVVKITANTEPTLTELRLKGTVVN